MTASTLRVVGDRVYIDNQQGYTALDNSISSGSSLASLADSSGGTADDTIQAIPDPVDAPGTADVLRDDLVANTLPAVRNDIADLAAKINALLASLRSAGLIAT